MIVALNNKSNLTNTEFKDYYQELLKIDRNNHDIILIPSMLNIPLANSDELKIGSQDVSSFGMGAYTGEVNTKQLLDSNVEYCLVGHSERREYQRVSNSDTNTKIKVLLEDKIIPILCIGESKEERDNNTYKEVLIKQIQEGLVNIKDISSIIIAYEPIWSIGTGIIPNNGQVEEVFEIIKKFLPNQTILYGGSANEENIDELKKISLIDGYLLGGLSLKPNKLQQFLNRL